MMMMTNVSGGSGHQPPANMPKLLYANQKQVQDSFGNTRTVLDGRGVVDTVRYIREVHDTNLDGYISREEYNAGPGLFFRVDNGLNPEQEDAFYNAVAGRDGRVSLRENAQLLVALDQNADGYVDEREAQEGANAIAHLASQAPGVSDVQTYNLLTAEAEARGVGKYVPLEEEQHRMFQVEQVQTDFLRRDAINVTTQADVQYQQYMQQQGYHPYEPVGQQQQQQPATAMQAIGAMPPAQKEVAQVQNAPPTQATGYVNHQNPSQGPSPTPSMEQNAATPQTIEGIMQVLSYMMDTIDMLMAQQAELMQYINAKNQ